MNERPDPCVRMTAQLATLMRLYRHLDDEWQRRFQKDHACSECAGPTPAHPPLPRDPQGEGETDDA